jgi:aryl-alcohol dehydrogenase-like predicted oxidoreductase
MYPIPRRKETQGLTEKYIGTWLKKNQNKRQEIIIASKVTGPAEDLHYISDNLGFNRKRIMDAIDKNLERLQTDYIDIYQFHWPERKTNFFGKLGYIEHDSEWKDNFEEAISTINELIQSGKIKHWGLSNETPWGVMRTFQVCDTLNVPRPLTIQNPYNLLNRTFEIGLSEICYNENLSFLVYSPLGFGLLSGKFHYGTDTPNDRINKYKRLARYNGELSWKATAEYIKIAEEYNLTPTQLALAFVNSRGFVSSNIIGATSLIQLKEDIESIYITLDKSILEAIETVHIQIPNPAP